MGNLGITHEPDKNSLKFNHINKPESTPDRDITTLKRKFHKVFAENQTVKIVEADIQFKKGTKLLQQKINRYESTCNPKSEK